MPVNAQRMMDGMMQRYPRTKKAKRKMKRVLGEFKRGSLHSGKGGPVVKSRKQGIKIALEEAKRYG